MIALDHSVGPPYAATQEPFYDWDRHVHSHDVDWTGEGVTVGIGVLCDGGQTAVIASDTRTTYPRSAVDPHDLTSKQWDFDVFFPLAACVAGVFGACQPVIDELNIRLRELKEDRDSIRLEHIENAIKQARYRIWRRRWDEAIQMNFGMTLSEWQRGVVPDGLVHQLVHDEIAKFNRGLEFPVELLAAGFLPSGSPLFFKASGKSHLETSATPGVYVIGTGGRLAMDRLSQRGQHAHCSLTRTVLHVSEALEAARGAKGGTVGPPQAMMVLRASGRMEQLAADASVIRDWKASYCDRDSTESLDGRPIAVAQLEAALQHHRECSATRH